MKYYLNNEEATRNTIDEEGWVHSGDVGEYNQQGFFKVVDRTKELVKVQGFQVSIIHSKAEKNSKENIPKE